MGSGCPKGVVSAPGVVIVGDVSGGVGIDGVVFIDGVAVVDVVDDESSWNE